jgi:excisionase family DNA binding protein
MRVSMSVKEAAEYLGVSTDTIYTMVQMKQIPHFRLRNRIFLTRNEVDKWLERKQWENCQGDES